ncbi:hypothetical protein OSSY52_19720 [Tepiditoga spiralis]|uniref:DUF4097 domain-containing protein n=1 Tax=Tepiditoga spiralis TaxID=2108365 RepID=A0A7G1G5X8_9BACT|nr:DUF4097 family beta strand repeat-containing protein [Tepiditoga spiralis]BBE31831.1 hypothetical protein OSSY52_19720 [Tepiditoga spiralis]
MGIINMIPLKNLEIEAPKINLDLNVKKGDSLQLEFDDDNELNIENYSNSDTNIIKFQNKKEDFFTNFLGSFISGKNIDCVLTIPPEVKSISIKSTNGDVYMSDLNIDYLYTKLTTGDIEIKDCSIDVLEQKIITGDLSIKNTKILDFISKVTTGDVSIKNSDLNRIEVSLITGDIHLDSLSENFNKSTLKVITGDAELYIKGTDPVYLEKKLTPYSASLKTNIPTINGYGNNRNLEIKATASTVRLIGKKSNDTKINLGKNDTEIMSEEEKKIIDLLKQGKISREFALELLIELGYDSNSGETFLKKRDI